MRRGIEPAVVLGLALGLIFGLTGCASSDEDALSVLERDMAEARRVVAEAHALHAAGEKGPALELLAGWRGVDTARALCLEAAAELCFEQLQPAKAFLFLDEAIALRPDDAVLHFKKGKALYSAGREREAEVALRECLALDWSRDDAKILLARILFEVGGLEKAAAFLDTVDENHAWTAGDLVLLGAVRHKSGRTEEALELFARAEKEDPSLPEPAFNEGLVFEEREDPAAAEESYRRALRADPRHVPSLFNLGRLMADAGKKEAAEFLMTAACRLEKNPNRKRSLEETRDRLLQTD